MDKKVELQVLSISNSQAQVGAFAMVLGEVEGERQLPIIIGPTEAQATSLYLKGMKTPRPLTHDLFYSCLNVLGITLPKVLIYRAKDGVFYSYLYLKKENDVTRIDARTSDAVALAVRAECPIFIYESILESECIRITDADPAAPHPTEKKAAEEQPNLGTANPSTLEKALKQAIEEEKYELAAKLRDEIRQHKE